MFLYGIVVKRSTWLRGGFSAAYESHSISIELLLSIKVATTPQLRHIFGPSSRISDPTSLTVEGPEKTACFCKLRRTGKMLDSLKRQNKLERRGTTFAKKNLFT